MEDKTLLSGIEMSNFDTTVRPQDDIYQYVNGTWLANTEIPADKSNYGSFTELREKSDERLRAIIEAASTEEDEKSEEMRKVGAFYKSYVNTELIEELGITPLAGELSKIESVSGYDDLLDLFVHNQMNGVKTPIGFFVDQDSKETTRYIFYAAQSGLGLPDRDYYLKKGERFNKIRGKYETHIANILTFGGIDDAQAKAKRVMEIETELAEHHWTRVENRDRDKTYNKYDLNGLNDLTPNFDWKAFYAGIGITETQEIIVRQPSFLEGFNKKWKEISVDDWKVYFTWHLYDAFAAQLSANFVDANFDMYSKTLNGIEENRPRWKRGARVF